MKNIKIGFILVVIMSLIACNHHEQIPGQHSKNPPSPNPKPDPTPPDPSPDPKPDPTPPDPGPGPDPKPDPKPTITHTFPAAYINNENELIDYDPTNPISFDLSVRHVGTGFNSITGFISPYPELTCLADGLDSVKKSQQPITRYYEKAISDNELINILNTDFDKYGYGYFGANRSHVYSRIARNSDRTVRLNFGTYSGYEIKYLVKNKKLSAEAQDVLDHDGEEEFLSDCGDHYIDQALQGGVSLFNITVNFPNQDNKKLFYKDTDFSNKQNTITSKDVIPLILQYNQQHNKHISVTINVFETGVIIDKSSLFSPLQSIIMRYTKGYNTSTFRCNSKELTNCQQLITEIIDYQQKDFEQLVNFNDNAVFTFNIHSTPYSSLGVPVSYDKTDVSNYKDSITKMKKIIQDDIRDSQYLFNYYAGAFKMLILNYNNYQWEPIKNIADYQEKEIVKNLDDSHQNFQLINERMMDRCYSENHAINICGDYVGFVDIMRNEDYKTHLETVKTLYSGISVSVPNINKDGGNYNISLIPIDLNSQCNGNECTGIFGIYDKEQHEVLDAVCQVDTSINQHYFKNSHQNYLKNKIMYCVFDTVKSEDNVRYIKIAKTQQGNSINGIFGTANTTNPDIEHDYNDKGQGFNSILIPFHTLDENPL